MEQTTKFEGWAIVEMMGHQREIGFVTTEYFGGAALFRVDVPERPAREFTLSRPEWVDGSGTCPAGSKVQREATAARTRYVAPTSLYALNPCTEEAAREALESLTPRRILLIEKAAGATAPLLQRGNDLDYDPFDEERNQ